MTGHVDGSFSRARAWSVLGGTPTALLVALLLILSVVLFVLVPGYGTGATFRTIMTSVGWIGLIAVGTTVALAAGAIDFSIMATAAMAGVALASVGNAYGPAAGVLAALGVGLVVGLLNATLVVRFRLNPFLATLATGSVIRGFSYTRSEFANSGIPITDPTIEKAFGGLIGDAIPVVFVVLALVTVGATFLMGLTRVGRRLLAVGGNQHAARLSGISPDRTRAAAYLVSGVAASIAGMFLAGLLGSGLPAVATGQELALFSAVLLGGTALWGGRANVLGAVVAVVLINALYTGIVLAGLPNWLPGLISALLLLVSIWLSGRPGRVPDAVENPELAAARHSNTKESPSD